jgi:hypothetical protein
MKMLFIVVVLVAAGLFVFLKFHDTAGCAVQHLPHLQWQAFRTCAATH